MRIEVLLFIAVGVVGVAAVIGVVVSRPGREARRARVMAEEQRDNEETVAYLAALRPTLRVALRPGVARPELQRLRRARRLGRVSLRLTHRHGRRDDVHLAAAA